MSTFNGNILEIPCIAVDFFDKTDRQFYFVSHLHSDHLQGLKNLKTEVPIFATPLSVFILSKKFPNINFCELEIGYTKALEVKKEDGSIFNFNVTSINAGHCLGACMLLFQIEGCDILYTGDIRISLNNTKNIKLLREVKEYGKLILYLDSTFMKETYKKFPTQRESIETAIDVIQKHLKASSSHKVQLTTSARYGYERLFMEMHKRLGEKIFIHEHKVYEQYSQISEISSCITSDILNARVFLKPKYGVSKTAATNTRNILDINFSAMYWGNWREGNPLSEKISDNFVRICYATHNSLEEIHDFLMYLQPKKVNLNVVPAQPHEKIKMFAELRKIERNYKEVEEEEEKPKIIERKFSFKRIRSNNNNLGNDAKKLKS